MRLLPQHARATFLATFPRKACRAALASLLIFFATGCSPKSTQNLVDQALNNGVSDNRVAAVEKLRDEEALVEVFTKSRDPVVQHITGRALGPRLLLKHAHRLLARTPSPGDVENAKALFQAATLASGSPASSRQSWLAVRLGTLEEQTGKPNDAARLYLSADEGNRAAALRLGLLSSNVDSWLFGSVDFPKRLADARDAGSRAALLEGCRRELRDNYDKSSPSAERARVVLQQLAKNEFPEGQYCLACDLRRQAEDGEMGKALPYFRNAASEGCIEAIQTLAGLSDPQTGTFQPLEQRRWASLAVALDASGTAKEESPPPSSVPVWALGNTDSCGPEEIEVSKIIALPPSFTGGLTVAFVVRTDRELLLCNGGGAHPSVVIASDPALLRECLLATGPRQVVLVYANDELKDEFQFERRLGWAAEAATEVMFPQEKRKSARFRVPELAGPESHHAYRSLFSLLTSRQQEDAK